MKNKMSDHSSKGGSKNGEPAAGTPIFLRVSTIENPFVVFVAPLVVLRIINSHPFPLYFIYKMNK